MKKYKIMLSALLVFSLFNIQMNDVNAKGSVVIDSGTAEEHTIPADVTGSIEPGLADGFVQTNSKKLNFEKVNLEGLSLEHEASIRGVEPADDGTFFVLLYRSSLTPSSTKVMYSSFILNVDASGKVLRSLDVSTGENGVGMAGVAGVDESRMAGVSSMELDGDTVTVFFRGYLPDVTPPSQVALGSSIIFSTNIALDGTGNSWVATKDLEGAEKDFSTSRKINIFDSATGKYVFDDNYATYNNYSGPSEHLIHDRTDFEYAFIDYQNSTVTETKSLEMRTFNEMTSNIYDNATLKMKLRNIDQFTKLSNGGYLAVARAAAYSDTEMIFTDEISIYDSEGKLLHFYNSLEKTIQLKHSISTENELFFLEANQYLKKINTDTGVVTLVKEFPAGTDIHFASAKSSNGAVKYNFYGFAGDGTGVFDGYGGPSAIIGGMDENFNIVYGSSINTEPGITMNLIPIDDENYFSYGSLGENKIFANEPTGSTNSYNGNGWIDKTDQTTQGENKNVYMGTVKNIDDYAPAIKVGDAKTVNVEELSADEVEKELLDSVEVYDSFETNPKNPSNGGLTAAEMQENLEKRLNANPEKLEGPIDWKSLGLDTSKVGYNEVKFFITDTNNQITADSKIVNVIKNSTEENGAIAIDANNFHMNLADVASLDDATSKTNAQVIAWDMGNGDDLIGNVTVDAKELAAIQSTKEEGIFDLTFTVTKGSDTVSNTVKVFVGGTYDPTSDIVIFAHNFSLMLKDAASYPGTSAVAASEAKAYIVKSNTELDSKNISADVATLNAATKIGPYPVELTYTDGTLTAKASVIANVFDKTVVEGDHDAIGAKNIVFDVAEVKAFSVDELRAAIIARSGVTAWDTLTGEPVAYEFDESVVLAEVGEYSLTFITENGTEKTIIVYVAENPTCDNGCDSVDATEFITAQDFYLTPNEVAALTEEKVIVLGNAKATNIETGENLVLSADYGKIRAEAGSYDVTYTTESGLEKTVKATVGNNLVDDNGVALAADNVVMWDYEVAAFNEDRDAFNDDLVIRSKARAWLIDDNSTLLPVTADSAAFDMADLTPYSYSVVYNHENTNVEGGVLTTDARLTIKGKNTVVGEEDAIDANDFALTASEVEGLTDEKVIELANARAWLIADGSDVEITEVDFSLIEAKKGVYDVTFTSAYGTSTTVQAFVGNKNRPTIKDGVVVFADDYTKKVSDLPTMTLTDHIEAADASAIDQDTYEELEITHIDISNVLEAEGQYPAEFGVDKANVNARSTETQIIKADSVVTIIDDSEAAEVAKTGMTYFGSIIAMLILGLIVIARMGYRKIRR